MILFRLRVRSSHELADGIVGALRRLRYAPPIRKIVDALGSEHDAKLFRRRFVHGQRRCHVAATESLYNTDGRRALTETLA